MSALLEVSVLVPQRITLTPYAATNASFLDNSFGPKVLSLVRTFRIEGARSDESFVAKPVVHWLGSEEDPLHRQ